MVLVIKPHNVKFLLLQHRHSKWTSKTMQSSSVYLSRTHFSSSAQCHQACNYGSLLRVSHSFRHGKARRSRSSTPKNVKRNLSHFPIPSLAAPRNGKDLTTGSNAISTCDWASGMVWLTMRTPDRVMTSILQLHL